MNNRLLESSHNVQTDYVLCQYGFAIGHFTELPLAVGARMALIDHGYQNLEIVSRVTSTEVIIKEVN